MNLGIAGTCPSVPSEVGTVESVGAWPWAATIGNAMPDPVSSPPGLPPEYEQAVLEFIAKARTPLAAGDPRRHHFIPKFFLRRFADERDQLNVVSLAEGAGNPRLTAVTNVAVTRDFYTTVDEDIGETVVIERILALADDEASGALARLTAGGTPLTPEDRGHLAFWLGLLQVRDPFSRRQSEALADQLFKMQLSMDQDEEERVTAPGVEVEGPDRESMSLDPEDLDSFEISPHQNQLIVAMLDSGMALGAFFATRFFMCLKFAEPGLVLSDRPMYLYRKPENQTPFLGVGPVTADEIWLPIDRCTLLILHGDEVVGDGLRDAPSEFSINQMNQALVGGSYMELYCHPDDLGRLNGLTLPNPNRPLLEMSGGWLATDSDGVNSPPTRKRPRRYRGGGEP